MGSTVAAQGLSRSRVCGISWAGDQTFIPCIGKWILIHSNSREVPGSVVLNSFRRLEEAELTDFLDPLSTQIPTHIDTHTHTHTHNFTLDFKEFVFYELLIGRKDEN